MADVHGHGVLRAERRVLPHEAVYLRRGKHPSGVFHQQLEDIVFRRRQRDLLAAERDALGGVVQLDAVDAHILAVMLLRGGPGRAPQLRLDAGEQLERVERLCHIVVRPDGQPEYLIRVLAFRRQQDHRHAALLAQLHRRAETVQPRHHHIHQHKIHAPALQQLQRLRAVFRLEHAVALAGQINAQRAPDVPVVVADQDRIHTIVSSVLFLHFIP